jgi:rod shape determining protein RodA
VPQQDTDFIFCTVGEEYGWIGSLILLTLYFLLLFQMVQMAENSKSRFARIYGYSIASIFFFHIAVNLGMTMGLAPVIGIPLPFFSYGGSSLLSFTIMLAILANLYNNRVNILGYEN